MDLFCISCFEFVLDFEFRFSDFPAVVGHRRCRSLTHPTKTKDRTCHSISL